MDGKFEQFAILGGETVENKKIIGALGIAFNFSPEKIALYSEMLKDIPAETLNAAVKQVINTSVYPPTVAEIRKTAERLSGKQAPDYTAAWGRFKRGFSRWGSYRKAEFLAELERERDPALIEAVKRFGWEEYGASATENESVQRAQFREIYNAVADRMTESRRMAALTGDKAYLPKNGEKIVFIAGKRA